MPSIVEKLRARMLSRDMDAWNHEQRALVLLPVWAVLGYTIGYLGGVHWVPPIVPEAIVPELSSAIGILGGTALVALTD